MIFGTIVEKYEARGKNIRNEDIYNNYGSYPVYSAQTSGPFGFFNQYNYLSTPYTFICSLNGNAGYISLIETNKKFFFSADVSVFEIKDSFANNYDKKVLSLWIQDFFIKNRHVTGSQPKFAITRVLDKEIDLEILDKINNAFNSINQKNSNYNYLLSCNKIEKTNSDKFIELNELIVRFKERGKRLVKGRDLYINHGKFKVISSTTDGPMGFYNDYNYQLNDREIIYSIDGANAGYVSLYKPQKIFLTDHAGIIEIKKEYIDAFGLMNLALALQDHFVKNRSNNGSQPTFMLKNILNTKINISLIERLSSSYINK